VIPTTDRYSLRVNRLRFEPPRISGSSHKVRLKFPEKCGWTESELHARGPGTVVKTSPGALKKISFFVNAVIRGWHVKEIESARFRSFSAFFTSFNQWAGSVRTALTVDLSSAVDSHLRDDEIESFGKFGIDCVGQDQSRLGDVDQHLVRRYWRPWFALERAFSFDELLETIRSFQWLRDFCGPVQELQYGPTFLYQVRVVRIECFSFFSGRTMDSWSRSAAFVFVSPGDS